MTFVDQRFLIDGWGSIIGAGNELSDEPLAVTGGTGAVGTYTGDGLPSPVGTGDLTFEFNLGDDGDDGDDDDNDDDDDDD